MTKTSRDQMQLRAILRLLAIARINVGEASAAGRSGEAASWLDVAEFLAGIAGWMRSSGRSLPRQLSLFSD